VIKNFTGLSSPYESPDNPELILDTKNSSLQESVDKLEAYFKSHFIIAR